MTGNLQADGVQSCQTLFVRYCLESGSENRVWEITGCLRGLLVQKITRQLRWFPCSYSPIFMPQEVQKRLPSGTGFPQLGQVRSGAAGWGVSGTGSAAAGWSVIS